MEIVQKEGNRDVKRTIDAYNLDMIISIGYRVNSRLATQFRIWATNVLRKYLVEGYAINQLRLEADAKNYEKLQANIATLRKVIDNETFTLAQSKELIKIISDYAKSLDLISQFDNQVIKKPQNLTKADINKIKYEEALAYIIELRQSLNAHELFEVEKEEGLKSALKSIFQTYGGKELYPSVEEKAANLLYMIIKNLSSPEKTKPIF
ncbi:hypothetical protein GF357_01950 [Candidatus Dojkabacteria bacterium]|nr:hypothetical protein [Candidatus Dojkabacteria bacterium]